MKKPKKFDPTEKQTIAICATLFSIASTQAGYKRTPEEAITAATNLVLMVEEHTETCALPN